MTKPRKPTKQAFPEGQGLDPGIMKALASPFTIPPAPVNPGPIPGVNFESWLADIMPEIGQAQKMIEEQLSQDHSSLAAQATMTEDAYCRMVEILSQADAFLDYREYQEIMKIDRDLTVPERNIILKVKVMQERQLRDKIKGLCESLKSRMRRANWQV